MKKIFLIAILGLFTLTSFSQALTPRFGGPPPADNTGRNLTYISLSPTLLATDSIAPNASYTFYKFTTLAEAKTITANVKRSRKCDHIEMVFTSDGTGRVVTFSTGFIPLTTLTLVASKKATINFVFDGVAWLEESRSIQP